MSTLAQLLRGLIFFVLTLFGMVMALVFTACTMIAMAVLYVLARIQGRPFRMHTVRTWTVRRPQPPWPRRPLHPDVMDVEMREVR